MSLGINAATTVLHAAVVAAANQELFAPPQVRVHIVAPFPEQVLAPAQGLGALIQM
jgi:hypothetical protein